MKGGTDQRISEQARARAGFHTSAWYPDDSPCLPTSSLKDQTCGTGVWPCTLLVRLGSTSSTCVAIRSSSASPGTEGCQSHHLGTMSVSDPLACPLAFFFSGRGQNVTTLVDDSPPKAAMHLPLGSSVRFYCGTVSCSRVPGSLDNIPCIDRLDKDWTNSTNPSPPGQTLRTDR